MAVSHHDATPTSGNIEPQPWMRLVAFLAAVRLRVAGRLDGLKDELGRGLGLDTKET